MIWGLDIKINIQIIKYEPCFCTVNCEVFQKLFKNSKTYESFKILLEHLKYYWKHIFIIKYIYPVISESNV